MVSQLTLNVEFAPLLEQLRHIVRQELAALHQTPAIASAEATGGIELARRSHTAQ